MNPTQYCHQKAVSPRQGLYYSLRYMTSEQRDAIAAVFAFYLEIEDIFWHCQEPKLAELKLNWWREEIAKTTDGKAEHPVAIALQKIIPKFSLDLSRFNKIIDGIESNLAFSPFEKFADLVIYIMQTAGARELLIAEILQQKNVDAEIIYQFALVMELVNHMQNMHRNVKKGLIYFSQDELSQFEVTQTDLALMVTTDKMQNLLKFQAEKIERSYLAATENLSKQEKTGLKNIISRCEISLAILRAIRASDFLVFENFINITPLHCWWLAWRS